MSIVSLHILGLNGDQLGLVKVLWRHASTPGPGYIMTYGNQIVTGQIWISPSSPTGPGCMHNLFVCIRHANHKLTRLWVKWQSFAIG